MKLEDDELLRRVDVQIQALLVLGVSAAKEVGATLQDGALERLLNEGGLTQGEIARIVGTSQSSVSRALRK